MTELPFRVDPLRAELRAPVRGRVLVPAVDRVEADDLQRAVRVAHGELLRVLRELGHRARRVRQARLPEHVGVVVEAVRVGEHRQRAAIALVLRVVAGRDRERAGRDVVPLHVVLEVDPGARRAVLAAVVGGARLRDVGRLPGGDRREDLRVVDAAARRDVDPRVRLLELGDDLLHHAELGIREVDPVVDVDGVVRGERRRARRVTLLRAARVAARRRQDRDQHSHRHRRPLHEPSSLRFRTRFMTQLAFRVKPLDVFHSLG